MKKEKRRNLLKFSSPSSSAMVTFCETNYFGWGWMITGCHEHLLEAVTERCSWNPRDTEILGWCPAGSVLLDGEKVPL